MGGWWHGDSVAVEWVGGGHGDSVAVEWVGGGGSVLIM